MIGKILGTIFGFMFGRIPGAILGFIVGHMFDKGYSQDFNQMGGFSGFFTSQDDFKKQAIFFHALFSVMGHIAKADGKVSDIEIKMASSLMDQMGLEGDTRKEAQQAFRDGKEADFALKDIILELKESCHGRRDILQVFLEILIQAAYVDGRLDKAEQKVLETAALHLGFKQNELLYLLSVYEAEIRFRQRGGQRSGQSSHRTHQGSQSTYSTQQSLNDAYQILGVSESDDDKAVKKAYRKLMSENHPDKLVSKGLPKQALEIAKNKAQDIQAAYEMIKEKRGMR
ncbi:MAG: co-chaperone DjlA [Alteromonadaceae bacterium]|uniref:Co-chaperone protein DjlA n=1 Tax=Paraglaciecola chathamensis TaxID=368405 RepID=A0A8H9LUN6_9ALTE|nr:MULTISPECIES: co-chaperone DjlA [Paraglaciecola]MBN27072.1 co-chaperone DjlA [Alteromonadaceae bacterium]MBJ2137476.1 co-chaperone DjlA [Paraglaciecola chathamensis]MBU3018536.1 co-chaperone DjlA [Paraglaciecola agarilytica]MDO6558937.1 co-chaperone DjlA [Paraglaciecola chathamensis]MDO6841371.1 co-chaperone DjlA [Paraglaciecola chathamensis]|tara:strand:- start:14766 stop:15620 length:855 start_codon:yes stop_codon:yes gene_type:complete